MHLAAMRSGLITALLFSLSSATSFADCGAPQCQPGDCCTADCTFEPAGTPCTDDLNVCTTDTCDAAGTCIHVPGNTDIVCRPAAGPCDAPEVCTGIDPNCPVIDAKSTAECRPTAGPCDLAESCDGVSDDCPPDAKSVALCRPAVDVCDVAESCDGIGDACPSDAFASPGVVCRPAASQCDAPETCTGLGPTCPPDVAKAENTPCNDGNACTRTDVCLGGGCTGTNLVVCGLLDDCHLTGVCNPITGVCSEPLKPDNVSCDDGNVCTTADSCQGGICHGLPIAGCCLVDADCDDAVACTEDRCAGHACMHAPVDQRCGTAPDCAELACMPSDPRADTGGCVARTIGDATYCSEDDDPCTLDACRSGACRHDPDGSGSDCSALAAPYRGILGLLRGAHDLQAALQSALATACPAPGRSCDVANGPDPARLAALLVQTTGDLQAGGMALAGRLAGPPSPDVQRDPIVRARLALSLIGATPDEFRAFLATLARARATHAVTPSFARARRADALRLLRGTRKVKRQLERLVVRRQSFAR